MVRKWITFLANLSMQFLKWPGFGAMYNREKDGKWRRWRRYGCNITPVRLSVLLLASLSQVCTLDDRVQKPTAPSWMGNGSSMLLIPTSLNTYPSPWRENTGLSDNHTLQPHPSSIINNSSGLHQFLETGLAGTSLRLCGTHIRPWAVKIITPHPELQKPQPLPQ